MYLLVVLTLVIVASISLLPSLAKTLDTYVIDSHAKPPLYCRQFKLVRGLA